MEKALTSLKKYTFKVVLAPILKIFECVTELFSPFLVKYIIDVGIKNSDLPYTLKLCGLMLVIAVLGFAATMLAQYLASRVAADYVYDLRKDLFHHLQGLSEKDLNSFGKGKILTIVNSDSFAMQNGVMMFMRLIFRPPFILIGSLILSFVIDYRAGLIFLGVLFFSSLVIGVVMALSPKRYAGIQSSLDDISLSSSDALAGSRPIRAFGKEGFEENKFDAYVDSYEKKNMGMAKINSFINPLTFCFINLGMVLVVYLGNFGVGEGFLTTGEIVSLISYLTNSLMALTMFSRLIVSLNKASASMKRVNSFFALSSENKIQGVSARGISQSNELIRFENVALTYGDKGRPAVEGLSFSLRKGETLGLIGGTGSGKSTTAALLEKIFAPSEGRIYWKGVLLQEIDSASLHASISLVSQKPSIFRGSIRSNLLLGKQGASEEEMISALKNSLAYEFVSKYDDGLNHPVEEGGTNLSGGQKQRLLIARALLKGGELLILDDSTSALDYLSEERLRSNLSKMSGLSKMIISQRVSSLKSCDKILVFDNGRIVAQGRSEELMENCSIFREIAEIQKGGV